MHRLISILRRPQTIVALVSERADQSPAQPYREALVPLSAVPESICPWRDKDVRAWRALSRVPNLSARAGLAIVRALIGSVADPDAAVESDLALDFGHGPVDLRPHLCTAEGEAALLAGMGKSLADATEGVDFPDWHWTHRHHIAELPRGFRRSLLWGLHLSPWERVVVTLGIYDRLGLDDDPQLLLALSRMLSLADRSMGIAWCEVIDRVAAPERARATALIAESGAHSKSPSEEIAALLEAKRWSDALEALCAL